MSTTDCMLMAIINYQWQLEITQTCSQVLKQLSIMLPRSTIYYNICWILIIVSTTDCMLMAIINCQWQLQIKQTCSQVLKQLSIMLQLGTVF